jgi:ABC transport system ATP-binding/permease protein
MAYCTKCSSPLKPEKQFCTRCGAPTRHLGQPSMQCLHCNSTVPAKKRFCTGCGAKIIRIGRQADNDVVLDYPMISDFHARLTIQDGVSIIEDLGSVSGTAIGTPDNRVVSHRLAKDDTIYFGSFPIPASRLLAGNLGLGKSPHTLLTFEGKPMIFGRSRTCDIVLDHPLVAHQHARISGSGDVFTVQDLGSTTGTFVNGRRISGPVKINIGDTLRIGSYSFHFSAPKVIKQRDYRGNVTLEARGVMVAVGRKHKRLIELPAVLRAHRLCAPG